MNENNAETKSAPAADEKVTQETTVSLQDNKEVKVKAPRTRREKLEYTKKRIEEQLSELEEEDGVDENAPVTVGMLKKMKAEEAQESAFKMADSIEDQAERDAIKTHLLNDIKPSGDPQKDLAKAQKLYNASKYAQTIEEIDRRQNPKRYSNAPGAPAKTAEEIFEPTAEELMYMRPPYNLSKEDILKARGANRVS